MRFDFFCFLIFIRDFLSQTDDLCQGARSQKLPRVDILRGEDSLPFHPFSSSRRRNKEGLEKEREDVQALNMKHLLGRKCG